MKRILLTSTLAALIVTSFGCESVRAFKEEVQAKREEKELKTLAPRMPKSMASEGDPINAKSRFASNCPYCKQVRISRSCLSSGGYAGTNGTSIQTWTITYHCRQCGLRYTDTRQAIVPKVDSLRLSDSE